MKRDEKEFVVINARASVSKAIDLLIHWSTPLTEFTSYSATLCLNCLTPETLPALVVERKMLCRKRAWHRT